MKRILVTGSRDWTEVYLMRRILREYKTTAETLVHGGARGADQLAGQMWEWWGLPTEVHPADWSLGKKAGPIRNQKMVDLGADLCLAFPMPGSRGTYDCIARAREAGIPVRIVDAQG